VLLAEPPVAVPDHPTMQSSARVSLRWKAGAWLAGAGVCLSLVGGPAWGQTGDESRQEKGRIVAAGFGCQVGPVSQITVKVYDAVSGEVLSDDIYELNVREGSGAQEHPLQERIFAGGVGLGAVDLSNFVVRVYDAKTGAFQWEGKLNLTPHDENGIGQLVSTVTPRRATITKIHAAEPATRQPVFLLRALDPSTGGLLWEDEFSADGLSTPHVLPIAAPLVDLSGSSAEAAHSFDFRIRMFDLSGRAILWEDQLLQQTPEVEEDTQGAVDEQAHVLPPWPWLLEEGAPSPI
jgi:hypothetical protein